MTIVAAEQYGREYNYDKQSDASRHYLVTGTSVEADATAAIVAAAPAQVGQVFLSSVTVDETADETWEGVAHYAPFGNKKPELVNWPTPQYSFDTQGATQHLTQTRQTISATVPIGDPAATINDFGGGINVNYDGEVSGVDVPIAAYTWTEKWTFLPANVTSFYLKYLFNLSTCVNKYSFRTFEPGEVIFLGASGQQTEPDRCEITYKFSALPNATDIPVGDITVPAKRGWDYMWVIYYKSANTDLKKIVSKPKAAYVEQVYEYADFSPLMIGF